MEAETANKSVVLEYPTDDAVGRVAKGGFKGPSDFEGRLEPVQEPGLEDCRRLLDKGRGGAVGGREQNNWRTLSASVFQWGIQSEYSKGTRVSFLSIIFPRFTNDSK